MTIVEVKNMSEEMPKEELKVEKKDVEKAKKKGSLFGDPVFIPG